MLGIVTEIFPETDTLPTRIKASKAGGPSLIISRDEANTLDDAHKLAAFKLKKQMGWTHDLFGGNIDNGTMIWIRVNENMKV